MVANPEEAVHDLSPKSTEIVGVIGKVNFKKAGRGGK